MAMIKILAPAKINLTLEVLSRRPDGYHEICSVMQAVGLCDELTFESGGEITLVSHGLDLNPEENLVMKAAGLLQRKGGKSAGARIVLNKSIPSGAGLGGGSSDAAATLVALNQLWELGLSAEELAGVASQVGSDVPFFVYGGTALVQGRGDKVLPMATAAPAWVVLLFPPIAVPADKTRGMYQNLTSADFTDGHHTVRMIEQLKKEKRICEDLLFNVFERVALNLFPDLKTFWAAMQQAGSGKVNLAGSGPVLYSIFHEETDAAKLYDNLLSGRNKAYLLKTTDLDERSC